jgi:multicomponent Na+:H+ antiporter subunit D
MYSWLVLLPFLGVIFLNLPSKTVRYKLAFWLSLFIVVVQLFFVIVPMSVAWSRILDSLGTFLKMNFSVDSLSQVLLFCIGLVALVTLFVQREMAQDEKQMFNFANVLLLVLAGMNGIVLVRDIFSLYVFLEITAIGSFILISLDESFSAFEGAFKYIILSIVATVLMLLAIGLFVLVAGSTSFEAIGRAFADYPNVFLIRLAMGLFLSGCFIKAGLMPFHGWLPDAYASAPASVSILLAGIVTKVVGVYTLMRVVVSIFGFDPTLRTILFLVGIVSIVFGALAALGQGDFKRMLAYSSISQVGYIILGLGSFTLLGLAGAVFHLFNHAIFKSLLFVNSAAVESRTGTRHMDSLSGLSQRMPVTGVTSILASLSAAGVPPLAGFWSKLLIIMALWFSGFIWVAVIAVLASVLTLAYFLKFQRKVFFGTIAADFNNIKEAGFGLMVSSVILAAIIIGVGVLFPFIFSNFIVFISPLIGGTVGT